MVDDVRISLEVQSDLTRVVAVADVLDKCKHWVSESGVVDLGHPEIEALARRKVAREFLIMESQFAHQVDNLRQQRLVLVIKCALEAADKLRSFEVINWKFRVLRQLVDFFEYHWLFIDGAKVENLSQYCDDLDL